LGFEDGLTAGFGFGEGLSAGLVAGLGFDKGFADGFVLGLVDVFDFSAVFAVAPDFGSRGFLSPFEVFASFFRIYFLSFSYDLPCRNCITQQILFKTRQPSSRTTCQSARVQRFRPLMAKIFSSH